MGESRCRSPEREALLPHDGPDNGEYGTANGRVDPGTPIDEPQSTISPEILEARKRLKYIFAGLALPFFLSAFDRYIVNTTYARIAAEFNALEFASWISTSYFLAVACTQPLWGKLSDVFGSKTCLMIAYPLFAAGGLTIALSKSFGILIAGRAIQGLGAGGNGILTTIILNGLVETRERGNWQAYVNLVGSVGSSLGAPLGGIFADQIGWRWAFFLQVPLVIVSLINVYVLLHLPQKKDKIGMWQKLRRLDFLGAALLTCTIFCLLFGIDRGSQVSFSKPISFVPLAACPILLVLLALNEEKLAVERFLPPLKTMNRSVWADYLVNLLAFGALTSVQFWVPFFYQAYDATTPTQTGIYLLPATIGGISGNLVGGRILKKTGYYRTQIVVGFFVAAIGVSIIVLGTVVHDHDVLVISIGSACASFFFGMGLAGTLLALICNIDHTHQGIFTACMFTLRSLGSASVLSLSGTAIQSYFGATAPARLPDDVDARDIVRRVGRSLDAIGDLEPRLQQIIRECYAEAVRVGFAIPMASYALAGAVALVIKNREIPAG